MPDVSASEGCDREDGAREDARGTRQGELLDQRRRRVSFRVVGLPQPKGSTRSFAFQRPDASLGTRTTSDNPRLKDWQYLVAVAARRVLRAGEMLMVGPVMLTVSFSLVRPKSLPKRVNAHVKKPDLDKLVRAVKDALTGVVWKDDSQVVELIARKVYAPDASAPGALVTVEHLGP